MTDEQIIEMANKVDGCCEFIYGHSLMGNESILAFAKLVAQHEREACAKVCDEHPGYMTGIVSLKIRARGEA